MPVTLNDSSILKVNPIFPEVYPDYYPESLEDSTKAVPKEEDKDVGFIEGLKHSPLATMYKEKTALNAVSPEPVLGDISTDTEVEDYSNFQQSPQWQPTDEELLAVHKACNWNDSAVQHILREARSKEDVEPLLAIYKENRDYHNAEAKAGAVDSL